MIAISCLTCWVVGNFSVHADADFPASFTHRLLPDSTDTIPVSSVLKKELPPSNLYFLSIARIHEVKTGPFHEHSSQLHAIATGVPNWGKVNSGLFKMYEVCTAF